jgi:hypothetical protein
MTPSSRVAIGLGVLLYAASVRAAPARAPTEADVAAAQALYRDARTLDRQGKLDDAITHAQSAFRLAPLPVIGLELGRLLLEAKRLADAYAVFSGLDALPASARESDRGRSARQEAASLAASLRGKLAALVFSLRRIEGVEVELDGAPVSGEALQQPVLVEAGVHNVTWRRDGRACASITVRLQEGDSRVVDLGDGMSACNPPPVKDEGKDAEPAAASPPPRALDLVPASGAPPTRPPEASSSRPVLWIGAGAIGLGLVGAVVGEYTGLKAKSDYEGVSAQCPAAGCSPAAYDVRVQARAASQEASIELGVGIGVALAGVGAVLYDVLALTPSKRAVRVGVSPTGVWLTGTLQ